MQLCGPFFFLLCLVHTRCAQCSMCSTSARLRWWWWRFFSVTLATELFAYNYLGQQQFRIYHFYAFCIKNKFNNCLVSGVCVCVCVNSQVPDCECTVPAYIWYVRGMRLLLLWAQLDSWARSAPHTSLHIHFLLVSTGFCIAFALSTTEKSAAMIRFYVWSAHCLLPADCMEKAFWIFHLNFRP